MITRVMTRKLPGIYMHDYQKNSGVCDSYQVLTHMFTRVMTRKLPGLWQESYQWFTCIVTKKQKEKCEFEIARIQKLYLILVAKLVIFISSEMLPVVFVAVVSNKKIYGQQPGEYDRSASRQPP